MDQHYSVVKIFIVATKANSAKKKVALDVKMRPIQLSKGVPRLATT